MSHGKISKRLNIELSFSEFILHNLCLYQNHLANCIVATISRTKIFIGSDMHHIFYCAASCIYDVGCTLRKAIIGQENVDQLDRTKIV